MYVLSYNETKLKPIANYQQIYTENDLEVKQHKR